MKFTGMFHCVTVCKDLFFVKPIQDCLSAYARIICFLLTFSRRLLIYFDRTWLEIFFLTSCYSVSASISINHIYIHNNFYMDLVITVKFDIINESQYTVLTHVIMCEVE